MAKLPKYLVRSDNPDKILLTDRDKTIIRAAYEHRLITTDQIKRLIKWTKPNNSKINARLKQLYDNKYLDRPALQDQIYSHANKRPVVHALGNAGAAYLKEAHNADLPETVRWTDKNRKIKSTEFIQHEVGITGILLSLQLACEDLDDVRYLNKADVLAISPPKTHQIQDPLVLPTKYRWLNGERLSVATVPDGMFALHSPFGDKEVTTFFFLEYDRNTMDVFKKSDRQSSIYKKMLGYADVNTRKIHTTRFGYNNFRVLFITTSQKHIKSIIDMYSRQIDNKSIGPGAFLFTTLSEFEEHGPFGDIWVDANNDPQFLQPDLSFYRSKSST
jgi:hypothetical protein